MSNYRYTFALLVTNWKNSQAHFCPFGTSNINTYNIHVADVSRRKITNFKAIQALIASQPMFEYFLIVFVFYLILHKFCSVLTCDILGIGLL